MPELPEVESIRRTLRGLVEGRRVRRVEVARRDVVTGAATPAAMLCGQSIAEIRRHGKHLAIIGDRGGAIDVHLGMSGSLIAEWGQGVGRADHRHVVWTLEGVTLAFRDPRRFGGLWTFPSLDRLLGERWARLGPDALDIDAAGLAGRLGTSRRAIKAGLLDQAAVAGLGNIYADEALHSAAVHPRRPCTSLRAADWERLSQEVRRVLLGSIEAGGSTIRDYRSGDGAEGGFQARHAVYGRAGAPCSTCGRALRSGVVGGRTTVWCGGCQPARGSGRRRGATELSTA